MEHCSASWNSVERVFKLTVNSGVNKENPNIEKGEPICSEEQKL